MMYFVDASALVKRYVRETHSASVRRLLATGPVAISRLSEVEIPSALARLAREGQLAARHRDRAIAAFVVDLGSWHVVELTTDVMALARRQIIRHVLRAGDAIQLASALWLQEATGEPLAGVMAFDTRLVGAARAEQLMVIGGTGPTRRRRRSRDRSRR
jgi:predicted nucleic acid-binding protein